MRKNREKIRNFYEKFSIELIEGWKNGCLSHTIFRKEEFDGIVTLFRFIPFSKNDAEI